MTDLSEKIAQYIELEKLASKRKDDELAYEAKLVEFHRKGRLLHQEAAAHILDEDDIFWERYEKRRADLIMRQSRAIDEKSGIVCKYLEASIEAGDLRREIEEEILKSTGKFREIYSYVT